MNKEIEINELNYIREKFESEEKEKWWTNPVSHGENAYASWKYQIWLEQHTSALQKELDEAEEQMHIYDREYTECLNEGIRLEKENKELKAQLRECNGR